MSGRVYSAAQVAMAHDDAQVEARLRLAQPPASISPWVPLAPARGVVVPVQMEETVMTPNGPRPVKNSEDGFHPARAEDAFDRMTIKSRNRKGEPGATLFTVAQVEAGRAYAALSERCASEGLRCTSPEARVSGQGGHVDWIEGVIARSRRLERMRTAIGDGIALSPRNARAHSDRGRTVITVRRLVDAVCIEGLTLSAVLAAHGWGRGVASATALRDVLRDALDRMSMVG